MRTVDKEIKEKPKFNIPLGLEEIGKLDTRGQIKFYRSYLEHLDDPALLVTVLKRVLGRAGNFGLIKQSLYWEALEYIDSFEKEFVQKGTYREVNYREIDDSVVMWPKLKSFINLLGIQGDNCQATFHHRYLVNLKEIEVIIEISKAAIYHSTTSYILGEDVAEDLIRSLLYYSKDIVSETSDESYSFSQF